MADKVPEPFVDDLDEKDLLSIDKALSERLIKLNIIAQADLKEEDGAKIKCNSALSVRYLNGQTFGKYIITLRKVMVSISRCYIEQ
jgi:hypothetical protein